ncbi:MAG: hypothetical protein ACTSQO_02460 [Candidatus Helarchaeota archaeon]
MGFGNHIEWIKIPINEYLGKGEYYAVFNSWVIGLGKMNNNSWQINKYNNKSFDKGPSLFQNASGWFPIQNDSLNDFLMYINLTHFDTPYEVNLSVFLDNEKIELNHKSDYSVKSLTFGKPIWDSEILYYLDAVPDHDIIISIKTNRSDTIASITIGGRYFYLEPANGTFSANHISTINLDIDYKKINSSSTLKVFFMHPYDWSIKKLYDKKFGNEIYEYGIYYSYIYGDRGKAIWYEEGGDGTEEFNYEAIFNSPNYISNTKLWKKSIYSSQYQSAFNVYIGDAFKIQAQIKNSEGESIKNGKCSFNLYSPSGNNIFSSNSTNYNGIIESNDVITNGRTPGIYSMVIYWSNGEEFGIIIYYISVSLSPWIYTIIVAVIVGISIALSLTYIKKKLQERNWVKSIHYLLVLNKKGGTPMYSYSFGAIIKDSALISGMISAISDFVKDTIGSKKMLRVIDQEDKKVILSHGKFSTIAILGDKNLPIIHTRSEKFLNDFEEKYADKITKWTGDMSVFKGVNKIIEKYFPISMEDKLINKLGYELETLNERIQTATNPEEIAKILNEVTTLTDQYQDLIIKNYNSLLIEIMKEANKKLKSKNEK